MTPTRFLRISGITLSLFLFLSLAILGRIDPATSAITATTEITVTVPDNLSLIVDNGSGGSDVLMNVSSSDFGSFLSSGVSVYASTNNKTGYTLTFSDVDEDNNLVENHNSTLTIPALSSSTPESSFPEDKWGFSLEGSDYAAVPLASTPLTIETTDAPSANTYSVDFGTKITANTPGGTYKDDTVFSLVANYVPPTLYIQDDIATWCAAQPTPSAFEQDGTTINANVPEVTMTDKRDGEQYKIRKLADGLCWMAENLRLGKSNQTYTIDSANSDVPSGTSFTLPAAASSGATAYDTLQVWSENETNRTTYGNYYNWYTATATTGDTNTATGVNAGGSICPKGLQLPPNSGANSFQRLANVYGSSGTAVSSVKLQRPPFDFILAGRFVDYWGNIGVYGDYWSSTSVYNNRPEAHILNLSSSTANPSSRHMQQLGFSIRCVTPPTLSSVSGQYIQDVDMASICANTPTPSAFQSDGATINANVPETVMKDKRDDEEYTIRKLADGNCWMTENLRLGKAGTTYTIDSTNSDVPSGTSFTLPAAQTSGSTAYDTLQVWSQNETNRQTYGNYYNWYTATAQTGTTSIAQDITVASSICPKRMKLPPNDGAGSYFMLASTYDIGGNGAEKSAKAQAPPFEFKLSGYFNDSWGLQESQGLYWYRTAAQGFGDYRARTFNPTIYGVTNRSASLQKNGLSIRCVTPGGD